MGLIMSASWEARVFLVAKQRANSPQIVERPTWGGGRLGNSRVVVIENPTRLVTASEIRFR